MHCAIRLLLAKSEMNRRKGGIASEGATGACNQSHLMSSVALCHTDWTVVKWVKVALWTSSRLFLGLLLHDWDYPLMNCDVSSDT